MRWQKYLWICCRLNYFRLLENCDGNIGNSPLLFQGLTRANVYNDNFAVRSDANGQTKKAGSCRDDRASLSERAVAVKIARPIG